MKTKTCLDVAAILNYFVTNLNKFSLLSNIRLNEDVITFNHLTKGEIAINVWSDKVIFKTVDVMKVKQYFSVLIQENERTLLTEKLDFTKDELDLIIRHILVR